MNTSNQISPQTRNNWLIDAGLFFAGISVALSGIYFLFLPSGGYRGGRNPTYGIQILFDRHTWDDLHTWAGVALIAIAILRAPPTSIATTPWKSSSMSTSASRSRKPCCCRTSPTCLAKGR